MIVFLIPNSDKPEAMPVAVTAAQVLYDAGAKVLIPESVRGFFGGLPVSFTEYNNGYKTCDVIATVGGDGTMLHHVHQSFEYQKPVFGINKGRMGFLATVEADQMEKLCRLVRGDYCLDFRRMLSVTVNGNPDYHQMALNDVIIGKSVMNQTVEIEIFCDNIPINHFQGDGVIIASPTGSTAYSFSAGGPILDTKIPGIVVTPICAHGLHNIPMVLSSERRLQIAFKVPREPHTAQISCDGRASDMIWEQNIVEVSLSDRTVPFVCFDKADQFEAIDTKLKG